MPQKPPPIRPKGVKHNASRRSREHLTEAEVDKLRAAAATTGRHKHRDATMILLAYSHALRNQELVTLDWEQINLDFGTIYCRRTKGSVSGEHPLRGVEIRALKKLSQDRRGFVFCNERGGPLSPSGFRKIVDRAGEKAGFTMPLHPHMLRHSCGYKMVNQGTDIRVIQVWMGHASIQNTQGYAALDSTKLRGLWKD
jgi:type 1 fimbriae regulatory protein FimB/type 1 fimbriae regulatory protein FimE